MYTVPRVHNLQRVSNCTIIAEYHCVAFTCASLGIPAYWVWLSRKMAAEFAQQGLLAIFGVCYTFVQQPSAAL